MNVLFMTLLDFKTIHESGLYQDLMREFEKHGHNVFIISPIERRKGGKTEIINDGKALVLKLKMLFICIIFTEATLICPFCLDILKSIIFQ